MDLAKLVVRLEAQSAQLLTELEKANSKIDRFASKTTQTLQKWAGGLTAVFSIRALATFTKDVIDVGDNLNDMMAKSGASAAALTRLGFAAKQNGSDLEGISEALVKLANNQQAALDGSKQQIAAFDTLGVAYKNADGSLRKSDEVLQDIAESLSQFQDGAGKSAISVDLLGKSGAALIPTLNLGKKGLADMADESDRVGATISDKTAKALGDLNDKLDKTKLSAQGVVASGLAPVLTDIAKAIGDASEKGEGFSRLTGQIENGFRLLADVGYSVYKTFDDIGTSLGALAAAAVAVAKGEFAQARDIIKMANEDQKKSAEDANEFLKTLWGERTDTIKQSTDRAQELIAEADNALRKSLVYGMKKDPVQEVTIVGARKVEMDKTEAFYDELNDLTRTQEENALNSYYKQKVALDELWSGGILSAEEYNKRLLGIQDELLPKFEVTVKRIRDKAFEATTVLTEFEKEAAKNTQDIIADTLLEGFDQGVDGILASFGEMLKKLIAQAVAADLAGRLFGKSAGGANNGGGGWIGAAASFFGGLFGGTKDSGGRGSPGVAYSIGTGAQPETFVPDQPGTFYPKGQMGGSTIVNNKYYLPTNDPPSKQTQDQLAAGAYRGITRANRRTN